ncbi:MAG: tetratricopeptide repeat protein [Planctomycetes bacterium]|nr:tetratricopeptide repeat protein [Planctomycetota bacterium]
MPRLSTFEKGVEYMDYSDYPRAIEQFKQHIKNDGEGLAVCYNLGVCYFDQQDYDSAVVWYEKALEYDPRDGDTLVNLGLTYLEQGRDVAALSRLKQAADVEKDRAYPLVAMAIYYQRTGKLDKANLDKARELYDEAATREEKSGYLWYHYGTLHELDERWGDAAQAYERSTNYDSTNPAAYEGAARAYMRLRNWRKAVQHYDFAIHLKSDAPALYIGAADALIELGRYERAVKYLWAARGLSRHDDPTISARLLTLYPRLIEAEQNATAEPGDQPDDNGS